MPVGYWCPVLHAHLPYVRHPEYPEFLEEDWFFEALTETYVPLVDVFDGLLADGVDYRLAACRHLRDAGKLEIITCGATHGFVPLMDTMPQAIRAQVQVAKQHYEKH